MSTMTGYRFDLACPSCGGELAHLADGKPVAGTWVTAAAKCTVCRREVLITATVRLTGVKGMAR